MRDRASFHASHARGTGPVGGRRGQSAGSLAALQRAADRSQPVQRMAQLQRQADALQLYTKSRAADGGYMIGLGGGCHCHIDIGSPHFKVGKNERSRIDFGQDMNLKRMQNAYETLISEHVGKPGYEDCKEYLEEQGCKAPTVKSLIEHGLEQGSYPPRLRPGQQFRDAEGVIHDH